MSYSCEFSFKSISQDKILRFLTDFKKACRDNLSGLAKEFYIYCPQLLRYKNVPKEFHELPSETKSEIKNWLAGNLFFKFFYNEELGLLGMSGVPRELRGMFDGTVHFQNSTDQDYTVGLYDGVDVFVSIFNKWNAFPDEFVKEAYHKEFNQTFDDFMKADYEHLVGNKEAEMKHLNYYRRTFCYKEIWSHFESNLWDSENHLYLHIFAQCDHQELLRLAKYCHEEYWKLENEEA